MQSFVKKSLLVLACFITVQTVLAQAPCSSTLEQEYEALMALYQSTNGANWTNKTGWSSADPNTMQSVQGWYGVTTNAEGRIIHLSLGSNNLTGALPAQLGDLCQLQSLALQGNSISGAIPSSIGNLSRLVNLYLHSNQFTSIPSSVENLDALKILYLSTNHLTGNLPQEIGGLASLEELQLSGNNLTGSIPATIGSLTRLKYLSLNDNNLSGPLPTNIGDLSALIALYLQGNSFSGALPSSIGNLSNLTTLYLHSNQFTSIPTTIGNLTALKILYLSTNQLSGNIPQEIGGLTSLEELQLSGNSLAGGIPSTIGNLSQLKILSLNNNQLSGSLPTSIGDLDALTGLYLQSNSLSGAIPASIGNLTNLVTLYLNSNQFTSIPSSIGNLTSLKVLHLSSNQLSGSLPQEIGGLIKLEELHLTANALTGSIPTTIGNLSQLRIIEMNSNNLSGVLPSSLGNLSNLTGLYLQVNSLFGAVPSSLSNLSNLTSLHLNSNQFTSVPPEVGSIISLQQLNVQANQLTFSSIVPLKNNYNRPGISYYGQATIDQEKNVQGPLGGSITLTTSIDRTTTPASVYQWFKVVNGTTTQLNTASTDGHTVTIQNLAQADAGTKFYYKIINPSASDLTLTSRLQTLQIVTCTTPTLDFQSAEVNGTHTFTPTLTGENCTASYAWDFGDGTTSSEQTAVHSYQATGTYNVRLTISYTCNGCPAAELIKEHPVTIASGLCGSIYCDESGGVGIGTRKTDGFRLSVNGKIRASDIIKVYPQGQWSDFVFANDYRLPPLKEVELFISKNGHLPGIPSAKEVENAGIDLGAMDAKLLQKIEELTLYMIELKKENEAMKKEIQELQAKEKK